MLMKVKEFPANIIYSVIKHNKEFKTEYKIAAGYGTAKKKLTKWK